MKQRNTNKSLSKNNIVKFGKISVKKKIFKVATDKKTP